MSVGADTVPSGVTRNLIAAVLETVAGGDLEVVAGRHGIPAAMLSGATEAFISAGADAVERFTGPSQFVQIDVAALPGSVEWAALVDGPLATVVPAWLDGSADRRFFFMHKLPGLRLRFLGLTTDQKDELIGQLRGPSPTSPPLTVAVPGAYDAEVCQLGGIHGLALAHHFFTLESRAVLDFHRLRLHDANQLDPIEFSLLLLHEVIRRLVGDRWEVWDVWTKMTLTGRRARMPSAADPPESHRRLVVAARRLLADPDARLERASASEQRIFERYRLSLPAVANTAADLASGGQLLWGLREIVPFWIIMHWNRMRFSAARQRSLTQLMDWAHSPKHE